MGHPEPLKTLPRNLEEGLRLLERGHALRNGGAVASGDLPAMVLDFLNRLDRESIEWVMVGAEAINLFIARPRATVDVDIVVRQKHLRRVRKLMAEMGYDLSDDSEVRLRAVLSPEPNRLELDIIKSGTHELFDVALDGRTRVGGVSVPRLEALLALKYLSIVSPWRPKGDKHLDIADFMKAYQENRSRIDRALLIETASRAHERAATEFRAFLEAIDNDRPITV